MEFGLHRCSGPLEFVLHLVWFLHFRFATLWCNLISMVKNSLAPTTLIKHILALVFSLMNTRVAAVPSLHELSTLENLGLQGAFFWISYSNERTLGQGSGSLQLNVLCQIAFHKSKCVYACTVWNQNFIPEFMFQSLTLPSILIRQLWCVIFSIFSKYSFHIFESVFSFLLFFICVSVLVYNEKCYDYRTHGHRRVYKRGITSASVLVTVLLLWTPWPLQLL